MNDPVKVLDAEWVPTAEERAADQALYLQHYYEQMARAHHRSEATDMEVMFRWERAKKEIQSCIARRKQKARERVARIQRVMVGAALGLVWLALLAALIG